MSSFVSPYLCSLISYAHRATIRRPIPFHSKSSLAWTSAGTGTWTLKLTAASPPILLTTRIHALASDSKEGERWISDRNAPYVDVSRSWRCRDPGECECGIGRHQYQLSLMGFIIRVLHQLMTDKNHLTDIPRAGGGNSRRGRSICACAVSGQHDLGSRAAKQT